MNRVGCDPSILFAMGRERHDEYNESGKFPDVCEVKNTPVQ